MKKLVEDLTIEVIEKLETYYLKYWLKDKIELYFRNKPMYMKKNVVDMDNAYYLPYVLKYGETYYSFKTSVDVADVTKLVDKYQEAQVYAWEKKLKLPEDYLDYLIEDFVEEEYSWDGACPTCLEDYLEPERETNVFDLYPDAKETKFHTWNIK